MRDPEHYETRRVGTCTEVARECDAPGCDVLVWPGPRRCAWHLQLLDGAARADEINNELLSAHAEITDRIFWSWKDRESYMEKVFLPALMAGRRRGPAWDLERLLCNV